MRDNISLSIFLLAVALFCGWNVYFGLRKGQTWARGFPRIRRHDTPWSYWVAISFWAAFSAVALAAFVCELFGVSIVSRR